MFANNVSKSSLMAKKSKRVKKAKKKPSISN